MTRFFNLKIVLLLFARAIYMLYLWCKQKGKNMKTLTSTTGNKKVEIVNNQNAGFYAKHIQIINTGVSFEESLIQMKSFITEKAAEKWAKKVL